MLRPINCNGCGANIQLDDCQRTIVCGYCGTTYTNPNKQMGQGFSRPWGHNFGGGGTTTAWDRANANAGFNNQQPNNQGFNNNPNMQGNNFAHQQTPPPRPKKSSCLFVLLIFAFWPGAIIYAVYTSHQQSDWDRRWGGRG